MKAATSGAILLFLVAVAGLARTQPLLARTTHGVKQRDDVYAFPPPAQLRVATLGWQAATVDLLWAKLLVEYGMHFAEYREFRNIPNYADGILALEPTYVPLYRFISTMLAYRPMQGTEADVRLARAYLERGTRERVDDAKLWMEYGQFIAFVGPSFLHDPNEIDAWRKAGAEAIGHAVELGADAERALTAATILTQAGATEAATRFLERAYALTEDASMSESHEAIGRRLATLKDKKLWAAADAAARLVNERWGHEMPFFYRDTYVLLGPTVDPLRCAGTSAAADSACARDWESIVGSENY